MLGRPWRYEKSESNHSQNPFIFVQFLVKSSPNIAITSQMEPKRPVTTPVGREGIK